MKRLLLLLAVLLLTLPLAVLAHGEEGDDLIAGDYTYSGMYPDESYEGTMTVTGAAPFYTMSYADETASGEETAESVPAVALGDVLVSVLDNADCDPSILVRQSSGLLFGFWHDTGSETASPVGLEVYTPQADTEGFVGTYDLVGSYATGEQYTGTVEITEDAGGWLTVTFNYETDERYPDEAVFTEVSIGMVNGNVLGYAYSDSEEEVGCGVFVARFDGDSYEATWVHAEDGVGTESGSRAE